jgi:hypothetical protein
MRSGLRALTASMLTGAEDVFTSANRFSPPARSTSSLRKLPRPIVIGGCSHTSRSTVSLRSARDSRVAEASAVSKTALMESASRSWPVSRPSIFPMRGTSASASVLIRMVGIASSRSRVATTACWAEL